MLTDAIEGGLIAGLTVAVESRASDDRARVRDLAGRIQTRVDLVLDGARKRNERVRPAAPGRRQSKGL